MSDPATAATSQTTATTDSDLRTRFRTLVLLWKQDRGPSSSSAQLAKHPAYQQIIDLGSDAIPLILAELRAGTRSLVSGPARVERGQSGFCRGSRQAPGDDGGLAPLGTRARVPVVNGGQ